MKKSILIIAFMLTVTIVWGQCNYELELNDSYGDGWNGNTIDAILNGVTTNYTLAAGSTITYPLTVNDGESIVLDYLGGGSYNSEVSFILRDSGGALVYSSGTDPAVQVHYTGTTSCTTCSTPSIQLEANIATTSVDLSWTENGTATLWNLEFGVAGFIPTGVPTHTGVANPVTISSLTANTTYDWYVQADCVTDSSTWAGQSRFTTLVSCPAPTEQITTNIEFNQADLSWIENGSTTTWHIEIDTTGFAPKGIPTNTNVSNPFNVTGLLPNKDYDWYVVSDCSVRDSSIWVGPNTFTTSIEPGTCGIWQICLFDTYGDGWNGGTVDVYVNGFSVYSGLTIATGNGPECYQFAVEVNDVISTNYTTGSYPTENEYYILDETSTEIHREGAGESECGDIGDYTINTGLTACDTCPTPTELIVTNETSVGADLGWTSNDSFFDIYIVPMGDPAPISTTDPTINDVNDTTYTWTGGLEDTYYDWYARTDCSAGGGMDQSAWVGSNTFLTLYDGIQIGSGSATDQHLPIEGYYEYTYSQSIYLASEFGTIGANKQIQKILYNYSWSGSSNSDDWVIYMGATDSISLSDYQAVSSLTEVFNGDVNLESVNGDGWIEITLTNPFNYNPAVDGNLLIAVDENTPGYGSGADEFYCDLDGRSNVSNWFYSDSVNPDPADPPTGTLSAYYPNTRFIFGNALVGDLISNPFIIDTLPYNDIGTTVGFLHDYGSYGADSLLTNLLCSDINYYPAQTLGSSPDVAYEITLTEPTKLVIDLCASGYDTAVALVTGDGLDPEDVMLINDDYCPGYMSYIACNEYVPTGTYYIIIGGFGSDEGDYDLTVSVSVDIIVETPINTFTMYENTPNSIDMEDVFSGGNPLVDYTVEGENHINVSIVDSVATLTPETDWYGTEWLYFTATDYSMNTLTDTAKVCVLLRETVVYDYNETGIPIGWGITHDGSTDHPWQKIEDTIRSRADSSMMVKNEGLFAASDEWLVTEEFDFTNKDSLSISFWEDFNASGTNEGIFSYSTDGGFGWNPLYNVNTGNTGIIEKDINLLAGESSVKFRWRYLDTGTGINWWNVDDVVLSYVNFEEVSQITTLSVADTGIDYVTLSWDSLTINYFSQYEIYYDTNPSVDTDDNKWSFVDDINLKNRGCTSTTIAGLAEDQYYFVIRGIDGFDNTSTLSNEVNANVAVPPVFSSPIPTNQPIPNLGSSRTVTIGLTITDGTGVDQSSIQYRYDQNGDGIHNETWYDYVTRSEYNNKTRSNKVKSREDVSNVSVEVTYDIDSDNLAFEWRAHDILGSDYRYSGISDIEGISDDYIVRIDTQAPNFVDDLICADTTATTIELYWSTLAIDTHFMQYEIYSSTNEVVTLADAKWDGNNDATLFDVNTISAILPVDNSRVLYFAICAVDSVGNRSELSSSVPNTPITIAPLCYDPYPSEQPDPAWSLSSTVDIGITFSDYYGIDTSSIQYRYDNNGNGIYDDLGWIDVYAEVTSLSERSPKKKPSTDKLRSSSNKKSILQNRDSEEIVLVSVEYDVDGDELHFEFRAKDIHGYGYTYSGTSNSEGILDDYIVKIDANSPADVPNAGTGNPTHNSLDVGWDVSSDDFFDTYQIYYADHEVVTEADSLWDKDDDPTLTDPSQQYTTITGLNPYTTYYFIIRAIDLAGNTGGFSPEYSGTTIGLYPPLPPQNIQITTSHPDVILNWDSVTEDTNGSTIPVGSYAIYNATFPDFPATTGYFLTTVNDTTYTHYDVLQADKQFYKVTAIPGAVVRDVSISSDVKNYFFNKLFDNKKRKN